MAASDMGVRVVPLLGAVESDFWLVFEHMICAVLDLGPFTSTSPIYEVSAASVRDLPLLLTIHKSIALDCVNRVLELRSAGISHSPVTAKSFMLDKDWRVFLYLGDVLGQATASETDDFEAVRSVVLQILTQENPASDAPTTVSAEVSTARSLAQLADALSAVHALVPALEVAGFDSL